MPQSYNFIFKYATISTIFIKNIAVLSKIVVSSSLFYDDIKTKKQIFLVSGFGDGGLRYVSLN